MLKQLLLTALLVAALIIGAHYVGSEVAATFQHVVEELHRVSS